MDSSGDLSKYVQQLEVFRHNDFNRDQMIQDILRRYDQLQRQYLEKCDDYSNEVESRRMWQTKAQNLGAQVTSLSKANESNPFVFAIIDGDGAVFQDALLKRGADGGAEAGYLLWNEIKTYITEAYPEAASEDWSIVVQVVLNLDGLAKKLHSLGIIANTALERTLADFGRGFGRAQPLFSFIDVGAGKESADHKIREMLRLMVRITQCKHVFFGPCHDNGYLPVLEPYKLDPKVSSRLTLIETTPAEEGFKRLGFHRIPLKTVFRTEKLPDRIYAERAIETLPPPVKIKPLPPPPPPAPVAQPSAPRPTTQPATNGDGGALLRSNTSDSQQSLVTTATSSSGTPTPTTSTWSFVTKSTARTIDISTKKPASRKYYLLNANSERVDEPLARPDPAAEKRFKESSAKYGNFCNSYHIQGVCRNDACTYQHGERLKGGELLVLRQKSRGILCNHGSDCTDASCMQGHHCRWLKNCELSGCRFKIFHNVDPKPRLKAYEDGSIEILK
ncbi:hypothetical protein C8035_v008222 [Colletotrichum spinosum]|uniref:C3H1-type domain-containing protein n=1 Tax=Colletotrichum spinosum TaxID=1347390 RepID=A0A4R8QGP8_9PEZI|nr:hypothetical protein C8035_v008222 [Colletotrichum spinosum]